MCLPGLQQPDRDVYKLQSPKSGGRGGKGWTKVDVGREGVVLRIVESGSEVQGQRDDLLELRREAGYAVKSHKIENVAVQVSVNFTGYDRQR